MGCLILDHVPKFTDSKPRIVSVKHYNSDWKWKTVKNCTFLGKFFKDNFLFFRELIAKFCKFRGKN